MRKLKLSTARNILVLMVDSTDHVTGKTGLTLTITASKAGAVFAAITPVVTERVNGWYQLALDATMTNTLGDFALHITGTAADPADIMMEVVAVNFEDAVRLGLTALPNAAAEAAGGLYTRGVGAGQVNQPANGMVDVNAVRHLGTAYATPTVAGVPEVDPTHWNGTAVATPTTAGVPRVDVKAMEANVLTAAAVADAAIDRATFAQDAKDMFGEVRRNTAAAGAAGTITLDASASAVDDFYNGSYLLLASGTGAGQVRTIIDYVGATKVATIAPNWSTNPDATSVFVVLGGGGSVNVQAWRGSEVSVVSIAGVPAVDMTRYDGAAISQLEADMGELRRSTAAAGAATTITLDASASAVDDFYNGALIILVSGTGAGQFRTIADYVGATKVATVPTWSTNPDATSVFIIRAATQPSVTLAAGAVNAAAIADGAIDFASLATDLTTALGIVRRGTAQAGAATTITLDASASAVDDFYNGFSILLVSGTGALQERTITDYVGATKIATVDVAWVTNPGVTSVFLIRAGAPSLNGIARTAGTYVIEGSHSRDDLIRLITGVLSGTVSNFSTDTQAYKSLNAAKTRVTVTTDASGRTAILIGDLT